MVSTDSAVVHDDVPSPKSYSVPLSGSELAAAFAQIVLRFYLLDFEPLLAISYFSARSTFAALGGCILHFDIRHYQ